MMDQNKEISALRSITEELEQVPGHLGFYYKNLVTGYEYGIRENDAYLAASVIKFPLLLHVLSLVQKGELSLTDKLQVKNDEKCPSCGALYLIWGEYEVEIQSLCRLMIAISDNTATNMLLRHCTIDGVNAGFAEMGLEKTKVCRLLFDSEAAAKGLENTICPKEMAMLLEKLYRGEFINEDVSKYALDILFLQQINHKMKGKLSYKARVAHKTGEDSNLTNDVGIVYAPQPFILCFTGHDTDVYRFEDLMRRGTDLLYMAQMEE